MGHRHLFGSSYLLDTDNDQNWSLSENTYLHNARNGAGETSSLIYPADNMSIDGAQYAHCNHTPMSTRYPLLPHNLQMPNYQQHIAGPSDLSMHTYIPHEDYTNQASSSNYNGNPFNEEELFDLRGRAQYKRKSPDIPDGAGSSTDITMSTEPWQETSSTNFLRAPWDYHTTNPNGMSIGGESSVRNVRSRSMFDLEADSAMTNLTNNMSREYYTTSRLMDVSPSIDLMGQTSNSLNPPRMSSSAHVNSSLSYELNPFLEGSSNSNIATRSSHDLQNFQNTSVQSVRGVRSGYSQRSAFRVSPNNMRLGNTDEGLQLAANNYAPRNPRPSSTRVRMSSERYRSFPGVNFHDRPLPVGLMIMDRTAFHGSRNPFDQHRDMRLDIDDMTYEDLLALGERIGSVGTGLPEHLFSKCVQESIYCSSDQIQDEGSCVICLEEYANMDDIGILRVCGHDFHVGCIKKWLSMKNVCPICKAEPMKKK